MLGAVAIICMRIMRDGIHYSIGPFWFALGCSIWSPIVHMIQLSNSYYNEKDELIREKTSTVYDFKTIILICAASAFSFLG